MPLEPTPADLTTIRKKVATATAALAVAAASHDRCLAQAAELATAVAAHDQAVKAITSLHAKRIAGEQVTDAQIAAAEQALSQASAAHGRAERAAAGARQAAARFAAEATQLSSTLTDLRQQALPIITEILKAKVADSIAEYADAIQAFVTGPHVKHHGEIAAISRLATQLGILPRFAFPNASAAYVEFATTPTKDDGTGAVYAVNLAQPIADEAARVLSAIQSEIAL